jgi:hypothetical protein
MAHGRDTCADSVQRAQVVDPDQVLRQVARVDRGQQHQVRRVHPTSEPRDELVIGDDSLVPRHLVREVNVVGLVEQARLPVATVALRELGGDRLLLRRRPHRQPEPVDVADELTAERPDGRGPRVVVGVFGHGHILEHLFDLCQDL